MEYKRAKAEVIDFGSETSFFMSSGGEYSSKGDFFAQNITYDSQTFYPYGSWPFTQFYCGVFTKSGSYNINVNGQPVTVVNSPSETEHVYNCMNYYDT